MKPSEQNDNEDDSKSFYVRVGPDFFISPPFVECPKCHENALGIVCIGPHHYTRRCKKCLYPTHPETPFIVHLPPLDKKLIYLDQFAFSNMVFALDPPRIEKRTSPHEAFYREAFERLDLLGKKQLLACPSSQFHEHESLPSQMFNELRRIYKLLSYGLHWHDYDSLRTRQIMEAFMAWRAGIAPQKSKIAQDDVLFGNRAGWTDRISISVNAQWGSELVEELRKTRDEAASQLAAVFGRWRKENSRTFDDWVCEETLGAARSYVRSFVEYVRNAACVDGQETATEMLFPSHEALVVMEMRYMLLSKGYSEDEWLGVVSDFLLSDHFAQIPTNLIGSSLWATVANRAAHSGQKRLPTRGFTYDVRLISAYLPYSDAMFLDKEAAGILRDKNMRSIIDEYGTRIYSLKNKNDFLAYLDEIENNASPEHMDKVHEVYGEEYLKPYSDVLKHMRDAGPSSDEEKDS